MKVLKFGGTSVGSIKNIQCVKELISDSDKKIVVLSAMSGTTNALVEISDCIKKNEIGQANAQIDSLYTRYNEVIDELLESSSIKQEVGNYIDKIFDFIRSCTSEKHSILLYNKLVAQGELLSTFISLDGVSLLEEW